MAPHATAQSIGVIVPATNRPTTLARCVEAIRDSSDPPDELIVVTEPAGAGPAAARNAGAGRATADILVFVDADVIVHRDALSRIRAAFGCDPSLKALFGSYDDEPGAPGVVSGFRNLLHHHVHQQAAGPAETFWAGLGAIQRQEFLDAGGFDEARFPRASIEDVELGMRLVANGARIRLDPMIQGTHLKRWTLLGMLRTDFARRGVPWVGLLLRSRTAPRYLNLGWRHRLSAAASLLALFAVVRRRLALLAGAMVALVGLNRSLYALVLERLGPRGALAGLGVHVLHHLAATASLAGGLAADVLRGGGERRSNARSPDVSPPRESALPVPVDEATARPP
jgi:glycosyltransferase involved in cell wall biosynthesis